MQHKLLAQQLRNVLVGVQRSAEESAVCTAELLVKVTEESQTEDGFACRLGVKLR